MKKVTSVHAECAQNFQRTGKTPWFNAIFTSYNKYISLTLFLICLLIMLPSSPYTQWNAFMHKPSLLTRPVQNLISYIGAGGNIDRPVN